MGRIIGIGGGSCGKNETTEIFDKIYSLAGKSSPRVIILPTAQRDNADSCSEEIEYFEEKGCEVIILRLIDEKHTPGELESIILSADIIYAGGGNLELLMNTWNKTGASKALKKAFDAGKVLCGYSSGMMCWFAEGYDDCGENGSFMFVDCLSLLPYAACPHFEAGRWPSFEQAVRGRKYSAFAAENGAAVVYIDGEFSAMCGDEGGIVYYMDKEKDHAKEIFGGRPQI